MKRGVWSAWWIRGAAVLVLGAGVSGCWTPAAPVNSTPAALPFAGRIVHVTLPAGPGFETGWQPHLEEWSAQTGAEVELHALAAEAPTEAWLQRGPDARPGLVLFPWNRLGDLLADDAFRPIPAAELTDVHLHWEDLGAGLRERACGTAAGPTCVPLSAPVLVCYYRADLLKAAGKQPPQTWEQYQELLDTLETWAPGLTAVEPWGESFRATMYLARAVCYAQAPGRYSLFFDVETGEPQIAGPGFVRGLEVSRAAVKKLTPECWTYTPADCRREMLTGRAALAIAYETGPAAPDVLFGPAASEAERAGPAVDKAAAAALGFGLLPGSVEVYNPTLGRWEAPEGGVNQVTLTGFAGLAFGVSRDIATDDAAAAWNLAASLTVESGAEFPPGARTLCRESEGEFSDRWVGGEIPATLAPKYVDVVVRSLRSRRLVLELPAPNRSAYRAALTAILEPALRSTDDPAPALQELAGKWSAITAEQGVARLVAAYRRHLGLIVRRK